MDLIRELYNGKIYPAEEICPTGREYRENGEKLEEVVDYLEKHLTGSDKEKFEEYQLLMLDNCNMVSYENFSYGFRLGVRMMMEALAGDAHGAVLHEEELVRKIPEEGIPDT